MIVTTLPATKAPVVRTGRHVLSIPLWALDGRQIKWNQSRTAFVVDCTAEEYHSDNVALSSTKLKAFARSPRHMLEALRNSGKETKSRRLGTAVHAAVLEAARFKKDYCVYTGRRAGYKWQDFKEANAGKVILTQSEWDLVAAVSARVLQEPVLTQGSRVFTVADMVDVGNCEQTLYWLDAETGVTCKARYDLVVGYLTIDLKTTDDARLTQFGKQSDKLGYDIQAAFYLRGRRAFDPTLAITPFLFIAAELLEYGDVLCHVADPEEFVAFGEETVSEAMRNFAKVGRVSAALLPGYAKRGGVLRLPVSRRLAGVELH